MRCRRCATDRPASELLEVISVRSGQVTWVCRPSVDGRCARSLRSAADERVRAVPSNTEGGVGGRPTEQPRDPSSPPRTHIKPEETPHD